SKPNTTRQFAHQSDFVFSPVIRRRMTDAERKAQLTVRKNGDANKRTDLEDRKFLRIGVGVSGRRQVADYQRVAGARRFPEFLRHKIRNTINATDPWPAFSMPVVRYDHFILHFVDSQKCAARKIQ